MTVHTIKKSAFVKAGTTEQWVPYLLENGFELPEAITAAHAALIESRKPVKKPEVPAVNAGSTDKEILNHLVAVKRFELFNAVKDSQRWSGAPEDKALARLERAVAANRRGTIKAVEAGLNRLRTEPTLEHGEVFDRAVSVAVHNAYSVLQGIETIKLQLSTQRVMGRTKVLSATQPQVATADVLSSASDWFGPDTDDALTDRLCPNGRPTLITAVAAGKPLNFSDIEGKALDIGMSSVNEAVRHLSGDVDLNGHDVLPFAVEEWLAKRKTYPVGAWA